MAAVSLTLAVLATGCASSSANYYWHGDREGAAQSTIDALVKQHPLGEDQNIRVVSLGQTAELSHHLVQVRHAEPLHVHQHHDLTVVVQRGEGVMRVGGRVLPVHAGDTFFVPRGVPHAFENRSAQPAVAIVVFTPPFDGRDNVPVTLKQ